MFEILEQAYVAFRLGQEGAGSDALVRFVDAIEGEIKRGFVIDERFASLIQHTLAAQGRGDYLRVADLLEFELSPLILKQMGGEAQ